jgi:hypothetical protein
VSANDNVKHIKLNIRYVFDNKNRQHEINVKYMRIHVNEYTEGMFVWNLPYRGRKPKYRSKSLKKQNMAVMASNGLSPHFPSLRLGLTAPQPSRRHHAQSLLRPSFHDPRSLMFSNRTPSKPRLSPATTMSDDILSALSSPLHCASISQPVTSPQVFDFESWTISAPICLNRFTFADSRESDL